MSTLRVALAAIAIGLSLGAQCPYQQCTCDDVSIQCHDRSITSLPVPSHGGYPQHTMDISYCNIAAIKSGELPSNLESLKSRYTPLATIDDDAFSSTLTSIFIEGSELTELPDALMHLPNLTSFDWSENPMTSWNTTIIAVMGKTVTTLAIENMNLNTTNVDWLKSFKLLDSLSLYHTQITDVPSFVSGFTQLLDIQLSFNRIHTLNTVTFPSSLRYLTIFNNDIEYIYKLHFTGMTSQLQSLRISNNPIKHISAQAFSQIPDLKILVLSATDLTRLPLTLGLLTHLSSLDLHNVPTLQCTCQESALSTWYHSMTSLTIDGDCGASNITYFLDKLAPSCPGQTSTILSWSN